MNNSSFNKAMRILKYEGPVVLGKKGGKFLKSKLVKSSKPTELYEYLSNPLFHITEEDKSKSRKVSASKIDNRITSALWFVPYFDHITFGGIYTIFRFMEAFAKNGVHTTIVMYDYKYLDAKKSKQKIISHFPGLASADLLVFDHQTENIDDLPAADMAFATIWMSAYLLLRYNQTRRKYYFIQDYEPLFYEAGSMYALAESTYRFGFTGIVNTPGLLWAINQRHGLEGVSFIPAVDKHNFYSSERTKKNRVRIFFYARPNNPRNAFELGILIIKDLLAKYKGQIEIVTAGAQWDEAQYGLKGLITNHGLIGSLKEVGDLYRTCDIGYVYMLSKHPSYQPFEFMACGMATVTNYNEDNLWLFKDGQNCLLAEPSPTAMAEKIGQLIEDENLRIKLASTGHKNVNFDWDTQTKEIWNYISRS